MARIPIAESELSDYRGGVVHNFAWVVFRFDQFARQWYVAGAADTHPEAAIIAEWHGGPFATIRPRGDVPMEPPVAITFEGDVFA